MKANVRQISRAMVAVYFVSHSMTTVQN